MEKIEKTIDVRCPLKVVYNQWTRFEDYPEFVSSVLEVRQVDENHVHCHAEFGGNGRVLDAEIIVLSRKVHSAWKSLSGTPSVGVVHFEPLGPQLTRVRLMMAYEPANDDGRTTLESLSRSVQHTAEDFKRFIESRASTR